MASRQPHIPGVSSTESQAPQFDVTRPLDIIVVKRGGADEIQTTASRIVRVTCGRQDCHRSMIFTIQDFTTWSENFTRPCTHCCKIGRT